MRRIADIYQDELTMQSVLGLSNVFSGLASMRIGVIKDQVLSSKIFFGELFSIYSKIRIVDTFNYGRLEHDKVINKTLFVLVTSEGGFSGDIDQKLIKYMRGFYDESKHDILVIGHHGAMQLAQAGISFLRYFKMPLKDSGLNVDPLLSIIKNYQSTTVFYQTYVTLMVQDIKKLDLHSAVLVNADSRYARADDEINELTYIFEPDVQTVIAHLEANMLKISLTQTIFESKLAQYASRFRAMQSASDKASNSARELTLEYNKTKRYINDERLKEVITALKFSQNPQLTP